MIIWVSHAWSWYWYIHAACEVLSCFKLEARIPLNYVLLCDCLEPIIDDFIRPECCKRQSNFYIAIRWDSAQWSLACLECSLRCSLFIIVFQLSFSWFSFFYQVFTCYNLQFWGMLPSKAGNPTTPTLSYSWKGAMQKLAEDSVYR